MVPMHSHEEIDKAVKSAYEELGSPVPQDREDEKKLIFDIRAKTAFGTMSIKLSLLRLGFIKVNHPIDINEYPGHPYFEVYYPDHTMIYNGTDILMFHWIRTQIKKHEIYGCYVKFKDDIITIDHQGNLSHYPDGFDDLISSIFMKLI